MSGSRVCLLSPGQPSTNPRLVKEADALAEAGYRVQALCGVWADWAEATDRELLRDRSWRCRYVGGRPGEERLLYHWTRLRYAAGRRLAPLGPSRDRSLRWGLSRVGEELRRAALASPADLYIAHYPGALAAAAEAAARHGGRLGYDLEDFYSDRGAVDGPRLALIESCERRYLPRCDFVTAASPGIARGYRDKYGIPEPVCILNVFPASMRPARRPEASTAGPLRLYWFSQTIGAGRGLEDAVKALAAVAELPIELHLQGVWQEGFERALRGLAERRGLPAGRIHAHPPVPPGRMVRESSRYDVGLALEPARDCNNDLTVSNKLFTYLLAGNALLATRTRGQAEICRQLGEAAATVPCGDAEALAGQLRTWYHDRESLNRARAAAWRAGGLRYHWDREKMLLLELVSRTLEGPARREPAGAARQAARGV